MYRDPRVEGAVGRLARLGCAFGFSHGLVPGEVGSIHAIAGVGGVITQELIPAAIEHEAAKADNQAKLREPKDAKRRHLFVVADSSTTVIIAADREHTSAGSAKGVVASWSRATAFSSPRSSHSTSTSDGRGKKAYDAGAPAEALPV